MSLSDLLLLAALVLFIVSAVVTYVRAKTFAYTDIGLALLVAAMLVAGGVVAL